MIDPRGLSPVQWAGAMAVNLSRIGAIDQLENNLDWRSWAARICDLPAIRRQAPPDPYQADSFERWAEIFGLIVVLGD